MACKITKTGLKMCKGMSVVAEYGRGARVEERQLINTKTFKPTRKMMILHSGQYRKAGIIMNHCPFCGSEIYKRSPA